jgi:hypothetical protein
MSQITKAQLAEWEQREAAYYAEAEKWKQIGEKMKRRQEEQIAEWKRKDEALQRYQELNTYSEQEIRDAEYQIKMNRLKIILTHNKGSN